MPGHPMPLLAFSGMKASTCFTIFCAQIILSIKINRLLKLHWQCRYDEFDVADRLRQRGWVVPAYTMAPGAEVSVESPCCSVRLYSILDLAVSGLCIQLDDCTALTVTGNPNT